MSEIERQRIMQDDQGDSSIMVVSRTVMVRVGVLSKLPDVKFRNVDWRASHADRGPRRVVEFPRDVWEEMGRPKEITVTIEPGDKINVESEAR